MIVIMVVYGYNHNVNGNYVKNWFYISEISVMSKMWPYDKNENMRRPSRSK